MSDLNKSHIEIFRQILMPVNDGMKEDALGRLSAALQQDVSFLEGCLQGSMNMGTMVSKLNAESLADELKELQLEYYMWLAHIKVQGGTHPALQWLDLSQNVLFKEAVDLAADEEGFNDGVRRAIVQVERESLKKQMKAIDWEDEMQVVEKKPVRMKPVAKVIKMFNHEITRSIAASWVLIYFVYVLSSLMSNLNGEKIKSSHRSESQSNAAETDLPIPAERSFTMLAIAPLNLGFVADEPLQFKVVIQPDTLSADVASYQFAFRDKDIRLKLKEDQKISHIISSNLSEPDEVFIKIGNRYYLLKPSNAWLKLIPVTQTHIIDQLDKIVFENS